MALPAPAAGRRLRSPARRSRLPRGRQQERVHDPVVAGRVGRQQVRRDLLLRPAFARQAAGRRRVQASPPAWRQICLDRGPDNGVDEAQRPAFFQNAGRCEFV